MLSLKMRLSGAVKQFWPGARLKYISEWGRLLPIRKFCNSCAVLKQVTLTTVTTHRGPKRKCTFVCQYVAPPGECYYNTLITLRLFFIITCGIVCFLCTMHVFEVWASSSSTRLTLCQISFLSGPPLLS